MLSIRDLTVTYGRVPAVRAVNLDVDEGEIVALLGANGVGKSSTLLAVAGAHRPDSGEIHFDGQSLVGLKPEEIVRRGVGLVPEGRALFARLTVEENLRLGLTTRRRRERKPRGYDYVYELFPVLKELARRPAGRLSGGEQQQLAIARTLLCRPKLLLLDEPSLGLAPVVIDRVFATLADLRESGVTILLVEQNATRTAKLADRIYLMQSGRIVVEGPAAAVTASETFHKIYLGV